jgi:hypothetical protein
MNSKNNFIEVTKLNKLAAIFIPFFYKNKIYSKNT